MIPVLKIFHTIQQYEITYFVNQPVTQVDTAPTMPDWFMFESIIW